MHRLSRALTALRAHWPSVAMYLGFALAFFGARLWLMHEVGSATPYWDQWDAEALRLYQPYLNGTLDWQTLFAAHNEHRIFTTRIVALALLELNQRWNPLLHMMFNAALFTAVMTALCHRLARLLGPRSAPLLLTFALVAFSMPSAWENTLLGIQTQVYAVIGLSLVALWFFTEGTTVGRWLLGAVASLLAFFSFASGVLVLPTVAAVGAVKWLHGQRSTRAAVALVSLLMAFGLGVWLTPTIGGHGAYRAHNTLELLNFIDVVFAWPLLPHFSLVLLRNAPTVLLLWFVFTQRTLVAPGRWFMASLGVWSIAQGLITSLGRGLLAASSRYLDGYTLAVFIGWASLLWLLHQKRDSLTTRHRVGAGLWAVAMLLGFVLEAFNREPELSARASDAAEQTRTLLRYQQTHNPAVLADTDAHSLPYPSPAPLQRILELEPLRRWLPSVVSAPLEPSAIEGSLLSPGAPVPLNNGLRSWGSFGAQQPVSGVLHFNDNAQAGQLSIPLSGSLGDGVTVEVAQAGRRIPVQLWSGHGSEWSSARARIKPGPFSIVVQAAGGERWVAIGEPTMYGRFDRFVGLTVARGADITGLGLLLLLTGLMALLKPWQLSKSLISDSNSQTRRPPVHGLLVFAGFLLVLALRAPDSLLNPQFWAEDGMIFYAEQFTRPWPLILQPYAGYLHAIPRLLAWATHWARPSIAPALYCYGAWFIGALALMSLRRLFTDWRWLALVMVTLLVTPTNGEIFGTLTNVQWLTQFSLLVWLALGVQRVPERPSTLWSVLAALLVSLTGPFSILVALSWLTVQGLRALMEMQRTRAVNWAPLQPTPELFAIFAGAALQLVCVARGSSIERTAPLTDGLQQLFESLSRHFFNLETLSPWVTLVLIVAVTLGAFRGTRERWALLAVVTFVAFQFLSVAVKVAAMPGALASLGVGDRYYVVAKALFWCLGALSLRGLLRSRQRDVISVTVAGLLALGVGLLNPQALQRQGLVDLNWPEQARKLDTGARQVPINPKPWRLDLDRQPDRF